MSGQIIKTRVRLVGQTSDYGSANGRSEGYVHRGRRDDKLRGMKSGGMGMQVIGQHVIGTLLTCRKVKTCQRTETTGFGAQEIDYRIGRSVGTRVDWLTQTAGQKLHTTDCGTGQYIVARYTTRSEWTHDTTGFGFQTTY